MMLKAPQGRLADVTGKDVSIAPEAHYDGWAESYNSDLLKDYGYCAHRIAVAAFARAVADPALAKTSAMSKTPAMQILDVGCGTGLVGVELKSLGYSQIDGLDVSSKMLAEAAKLNVYRQLVHVDAEAADTRSAAIYDGVISVGTFGQGHMGPAAMGTIAAHAKSSGLIVLFMNAEPYVEMNFQAEIDRLEASGAWRLVSIEDHNYMDALERPGKLVVARAGTDG